jgi:hypothetical protein
MKSTLAQGLAGDMSVRIIGDHLFALGGRRQGGKIADVKAAQPFEYVVEGQAFAVNFENLYAHLVVNKDRRFSAAVESFGVTYSAALPAKRAPKYRPRSEHV